MSRRDTAGSDFPGEGIGEIGARYDGAFCIGRQAPRCRSRCSTSATRPLPGTLRPERVPLSRGAWVDVQRGWLSGSAALFARLATDVPWRAERRRMYDRTVDVPRLLCFYGEDAALPDPALDACRDALNALLRRRARRAVRHGGTVLLPGRAGQRGLARRHDRARRDRGHDGRDRLARRGTAAAAAARAARRARPTGRACRYSLGHGDLIVMGGSCQRTWEHAIPKSARPTGPRISVQFRPRGVR